MVQVIQAILSGFQVNAPSGFTDADLGIIQREPECSNCSVKGKQGIDNFETQVEVRGTIVDKSIPEFAGFLRAKFEIEFSGFECLDFSR